jgi:hypothetical protein
MSGDSCRWTFERPLAALCCGAMSGRVDVSRPQDGVRDLRIGDRDVDGHVLAVKWAAADTDGDAAGWPAPVADAYVRGGDLVAAYGRMPNWPYAPQIYWRAEAMTIAGTRLAALSLLVSVQTDSLDTHPAIRVATRLAAVEVGEVGHAAESGAQALLWRLTGQDLSYVEIVPSSDFGDLSIDCDAAGRFTSAWSLFGEFLEKGVIRRIQVMSAFLPRERDEELAAECCRALRRRPLPLTA